MKDWTGNTNSVYKAIAATNHADSERELNDYYATDPIAIHSGERLRNLRTRYLNLRRVADIWLMRLKKTDTK